ncbi:MAG: hypothetical protein QM784_33080 [Polyangiaceae bacterium]
MTGRLSAPLAIIAILRVTGGCVDSENTVATSSREPATGIVPKGRTDAAGGATATPTGSATWSSGGTAATETSAAISSATGGTVATETSIVSSSAAGGTTSTETSGTGGTTSTETSSTGGTAANTTATNATGGSGGGSGTSSGTSCSDLPNVDYAGWWSATVAVAAGGGGSASSLGGASGATTVTSSEGGTFGAGVNATGGAGVNATGGASAGFTKSGCVALKPVLSGPTVVCEGMATVAASREALDLLFADGSTLHWAAQWGTSVESSYPLMSPPPAVWVEYERITHVVCPVCGSNVDTRIAIRDASSGNLLAFQYVGMAFSPAQFATVFGVAAVEESRCQSSERFGCYDVTYEHFDHELETATPRFIPFGSLERVTIVAGTFDIYWATSKVLKRATVPSCFDGGYPENRDVVRIRRIVEP